MLLAEAGVPIMPFHIRDPETDSLVRELAALTGEGVTRAVKSAVDEKLRREVGKGSLAERMAAWRAERMTWPRTGLEPDKAFYDSLNDE